jgi:voltage-gated potassium channel
MVVISISTIGYEDMLDTKSSTVLTLFNIFVILTSMVTVAYAVSNFTAFLVEGRLKKYFLLKKHLKRIKKMDQHYIICGVKDIGIFAAKELHETKRPFVVIDDSQNAIDALRQDIPSLVYFEGDATDDHVLLQAGIAKARALIACLDNDKENLYLVLAAKEHNPNMVIAAKYNSPKTRQKLLKAGASSLVSPNMIGGMRIASELLRPGVVSFLDRMLRDKTTAGIRLEELDIQEKSALVGRTLIDLYKQTGVLVISTGDAQQEIYHYNPDPALTITPGMTLIYIASPEQRQALAKL